MTKLTKEQILALAININNIKNYTNICHEANICPECGDTLESERECDEDGEVSWLLARCKCGYKYESDYYYEY